MFNFVGDDVKEVNLWKRAEIAIFAFITLNECQDEIGI